MPKRNAGFEAKPKGLCIFIKPLNLWDLALDKKRKSETKSFSFGLWRNGNGFSKTALRLAQALPIIYRITL